MADGIDAARVDLVHVPTRDLDNARRFYGETLGLRRNPETHPDFPEFELCHMAFFTDPDGNGLLLHRRYAPFPDGRQP